MNPLQRDIKLIEREAFSQPMSRSDVSTIKTKLERSLSNPRAAKSSITQSIPSVSKLLATVTAEQTQVNRLLDLGCGYGHFTDALGNALEVEEIHGVERDYERRSSASELGIHTHAIDLNEDPLPFERDSIDLVTSFGLLEHLVWYDHVISEVHRVLSPGGHLLIALPNMAGWTNRVAIVLGNQPRNVEISQIQAFGVSGFYPTDEPLGHVHTATPGALHDLLEHHGIQIANTIGLHPYQRSVPIKLIDKIVSRRPSLCRRFAVLGRYQPDR